MPDGPRPIGPDYDDDFYAWTQHQAQVMRELRTRDNRFDRAHVAEEIEDLGNSVRNAVRSQVRRILIHFLKLAYSPARDPCSGWMASIVDARAELDSTLSRSLQRDVEERLPKLYAVAREQAILELEGYGEHGAALSLPEGCPYTIEQVLESRWYPEPAGADEAGAAAPGGEAG